MYTTRSVKMAKRQRVLLVKIPNRNFSCRKVLQYFYRRHMITKGICGLSECKNCSKVFWCISDFEILFLLYYNNKCCVSAIVDGIKFAESRHFQIQPVYCSRVPNQFYNGLISSISYNEVFHQSYIYIYTFKYICVYPKGTRN